MVFKSAAISDASRRVSRLPPKRRFARLAVFTFDGGKRLFKVSSGAALNTPLAFFVEIHRRGVKRNQSRRQLGFWSAHDRNILRRWLRRKILLRRTLPTTNRCRCPPPAPARSPKTPPYRRRTRQRRCLPSLWCACRVGYRLGRWRRFFWTMAATLNWPDSS